MGLLSCSSPARDPADPIPRDYTRPKAEVLVTVEPARSSSRLEAVAPRANGLGELASCQTVDECIVVESGAPDPCVWNKSPMGEMGEVTVRSPTYGTQAFVGGRSTWLVPPPGEVISFAHAGFREVPAFDVTVTIPQFSKVTIGGCSTDEACRADLDRPYFVEIADPMQGVSLGLEVQEYTATVGTLIACVYATGQARARLPASLIERIHRGRPHSIRLWAIRSVVGKDVVARAVVRQDRFLVLQ